MAATNLTVTVADRMNQTVVKLEDHYREIVVLNVGGKRFGIAIFALFTF